MNGKTGIIKGFVSSKTGSTFDAAIAFDADYKTVLNSLRRKVKVEIKENPSKSLTLPLRKSRNYIVIVNRDVYFNFCGFFSGGVRGKASDAYLLYVVKITQMLSLSYNNRDFYCLRASLVLYLSY